MINFPSDYVVKNIPQRNRKVEKPTKQDKKDNPTKRPDPNEKIGKNIDISV